jgi:hypothetical protein
MLTRPAAVHAQQLEEALEAARTEAMSLASYKAAPPPDGQTGPLQRVQVPSGTVGTPCRSHTSLL